jgi:CheY-like chemotaxis protein
MVAAWTRPSQTIGANDDHTVKVLVIDDDPLLRDLLAEFLELLGHESEIAADGPEGLGRFDPLVHQAVLTDFLMPGMTGLEVAAAIRGRGCTTPIVLISGFAKPNDWARSLPCLSGPLGFMPNSSTLTHITNPASKPEKKRPRLGGR